LTVTDLLAGPRDQPGARTFARVASAIVLVSLLTYVAAQFQGAGKTFSEVFGLSMQSSVLLGATVIVAYTMMGGFWAASITDSLQGVVMAVSAVVLPAAALMEVGGPEGLARGVAGVAGFWDLSRGASAPLAIGFVLGLLGIGLGYPGQPHVVNRFMALENEGAVLSGRRVAMTWASILYAGMLLLGWCARAMLPDLADPELAFITVTRELFPPVVAGMMIAAVLSAIMSTADSQLLVAASSASHDLRGEGESTHSVGRSRAVVLGLSALAVAAALWGDATIFSRVLFAWNAMGAAFGPLLLVTVWKGRPPAGAAVWSMVAGFTLAVLAYSVPELKGGAVERCVPFVVAFGLAWWPVRAMSRP
jgi:SSS family transporter